MVKRQCLPVGCWASLEIWLGNDCSPVGRVSEGAGKWGLPSEGRKVGVGSTDLYWGPQSTALTSMSLSMPLGIPCVKKYYAWYKIHLTQ